MSSPPRHFLISVLSRQSAVDSVEFGCGLLHSVSVPNAGLLWGIWLGIAVCQFATHGEDTAI